MDEDILKGGVMRRMYVLVIAANETDWRAFNRSHFDTRFMGWVNHGESPLACIANRYLVGLDYIANHRYLVEDAEERVFGLCHADTTFGSGALDAFCACAMDGNVCGIVGRDLDRTYRWCGAHERHGSRELAPGNPGPVSTLDGCAVFFRTDLGLRFDEQTFDSWHCHVEDLCLQAQAKGIPVVVPAADASHPLVTRHINVEAWYREAEKYRKRLREKWPGVRFEHT